MEKTITELKDLLGKSAFVSGHRGYFPLNSDFYRCEIYVSPIDQVDYADFVKGMIGKLSMYRGVLRKESDHQSFTYKDNYGKISRLITIQFYPTIKNAQEAFDESTSKGPESTESEVLKSFMESFEVEEEKTDEPNSGESNRHSQNSRHTNKKNRCRHYFHDF